MLYKQSDSMSLLFAMLYIRRRVVVSLSFIQEVLMPLGFLSLLYLYTNYGYLRMIKMVVLFCNIALSFVCFQVKIYCVA